MMRDIPFMQLFDYKDKKTMIENQFVQIKSIINCKIIEK